MEIERHALTQAAAKKDWLGMACGVFNPLLNHVFSLVKGNEGMLKLGTTLIFLLRSNFVLQAKLHDATKVNVFLLCSSFFLLFIKFYCLLSHSF